MKPLKLNQNNIGCFINIPSPGLAEMAALSGFDMIVPDMEHGAFTWTDLENMIRACEIAETPCVVRIPERRREYILKALDSGASGIQVPMIETKDQAEEVVSMAKYPPIGKRGVSFGQRAARYGTFSEKSLYMEKENKSTAVIIQIESLQAAENIDEILYVTGVDVIFIGPTDLAVSMGFGHDLQNRKVIEVIQKVKMKALLAGKVVGILGGSADLLRRYKDENINYLLTSIQTIVNKGSNEYNLIKE
ncbi:4-hydroxy-2-oxoheptanedioate aldolase [Geomicrobium halophilum]|uniref:4-hydroxy-2-oxoheptanedioate aldolase n=1 Tax=Geomicrobium halophilum TaxID=549000 RepID=A0A841PX63_9BACL|nr:aldolase/citrate lyase family protein [Geomicrobium halophilum]MBB6448672.1 4-hydroxy-2-oxoheptanedioate aldolase [Geomicrobium halophilum]